MIINKLKKLIKDFLNYHYQIKYQIIIIYRLYFLGFFFIIRITKNKLVIICFWFII